MQKVKKMNEEELAQGIRTLEFYKAQMENFDQQFGFLSSTMKEHTQAKETLMGYKELKEGQETLIPIGAGSFLFAKVSDPGKAMMGMGADFMVEAEINEAVTKLDERILEIEEAMKSLTEKYQEMAQKSAELSQQVQSAYEGH
jgi:prefoldin alpha subunit